MTIEDTNRLRVRELTFDDVSALSEILGDPAVMHYSTRGVQTPTETKRFIEQCIESYVENGTGQWALVDKTSSSFVGFCGLSSVLIDGIQEVEIGYRLSRRFWGQGLATEAASQVLAHGFEHIGLKSVVAIIAPDHHASARVAEKIGFTTFINTRYAGWQVRIYRTLLAEWRCNTHNMTLNPDAARRRAG